MAGGTFVSLGPRGIEIPLELEEGFDPYLGAAFCLGIFTGGETLLPKQVMARFGGHAGGQIQFQRHDFGRRGIGFGVEQKPSLFFNFRQGCPDFFSGNFGKPF